MFSFLRHVPAILQRMTQALERIAEVLPEVLEAWSTRGPLEERLAELERNRQHWEATIEAELLRADSKYKSSRAAEERSRTMAAHAETLSGGDEGEEGIPQQYLDILRRNGEPGQEGAVQTVPAGVALTPKARALQAKFGRVNG